MKDSCSRVKRPLEDQGADPEEVDRAAIVSAIYALLEQWRFLTGGRGAMLLAAFLSRTLKIARGESKLLAGKARKRGDSFFFPVCQNKELTNL